MTNHTIFKSRLSLIIIFATLAIGVVFSFLLYRGKIEKYYQEKYYHPILLSVKPVKVPEIKIGFITDAHSYIKNNEMTIKSAWPLEIFMQRMGEFKPEVVIENGDLIEGTNRVGIKSINDFKLINGKLNELEAPVYHVLGNHELRGFDKNTWLKLTNNQQTYYHFDVDNLRVIVLDSNYLPTTEEDVSPTNDYTRGYVSQKQVEWLAQTLKEAGKKRKIVFVHHPPLESTVERKNPASFPVKSFQLRDLFSKYKVKAVFSGHIEESYHEKINGVDYFITPGFHKDEPKFEGQPFYKGVFSEIEVGRTVKLKMYYRDEIGQYQSIML